MWVDRHPGALNLDIDTLLRLVGGWQDPTRDTHMLLRPAVRAMAGAHLGGGHDVVLPQYLARAEEINAFAAAAHQAQAAFVEVILLVDRPEALARFDRRRDETAWHSHNRRMWPSRAALTSLARCTTASWQWCRRVRPPWWSAASRVPLKRRMPRSSGR